ncbi:phosphate regulon sensor histidine kinase PhoR [Teredinibacter turnerae]|uniref:phosphate regulon sensor histidine kinase PhoR n=1 Tax=Teredinibacter turnerae TaxID=2426 RepID=UPI000366C22A|nr:phosphate regulon sensor histidine kinase PhoR [Teredinibacter turnerae]
MFRKGVAAELRWLLLFAIVGFSIGLVFDHVVMMMLVAALVFGARLMLRISELESWVEATRQRGLQENNLEGVWAEIAEDVVLIIRRYEKDKLRLQQVVERVQQMTAALTDGVIIVDKHHNIEWWNRAAEMQFDFQPLDIGHKVTNYLRNPKFIKYYEGGDYREPLDTYSVRHEGQHLQFFVHPFGDGDRLIIARDVTRVANLERMRQDFVANVSHELRTPLTVLSGYLETLADTGVLPERWGKPMGQMLEQTSRMNRLINDLLTLSRLETDDRDFGQRPVPLLPLLEQIVAEGRALSGERGHEFLINCGEGIEIMGQEDELRSAIANLVYNAVNYTPDGKKVSILVNSDPHELVLKVKDNGEGIESRHIPRLTERFYRVDAGRSRETGGTGLGLAIVKHILLRHDADLKIRSKVGKGSTFSCHFPIKRVIQSSPEQQPS